MKMLKIYYHPNIDGLYSALCAAQNQREACAAIGCSIGDFKRSGGRKIVSDSEFGRVAMSKPGYVWIRRIASSLPPGTDNPWHLHGARASHQ